MKKFICLATALYLYLLCAFSAPLSCVTAAAQTDARVGAYACILDNRTFFYAQRDENSGLFLIPQTYYVKILDVAPDFCKIEYLYDDTQVQKRIGYAKTTQLTVVDYVPKRPYLYYLFEVRYTINQTTVRASSILDQIIRTCAYYGDYIIGSQAYCYVLCDGTFGYVPKPTDFIFTENTEYAEWLQQTSAPSVDTAAPNNTVQSSPAQIAILIAVCLLVPVLAALILRSAKPKAYEEDDTDEE